jgi:hypothetical protein
MLMAAFLAADEILHSSHACASIELVGTEQDPSSITWVEW